MDDRRPERPYEGYEDRYDTRYDHYSARYGGDSGGYAAQNDYQSYEARPGARNWQEVIAGALITAAGLYLISRGSEQRRERHNLPPPFSGGSDSGNEREGGIQVRVSVTSELFPELSAALKPASSLLPDPDPAESAARSGWGSKTKRPLSPPCSRSSRTGQRRATTRRLARIEADLG